MAAYIVYLSPCFYIKKHIDVVNGTRIITTEYWRNAREYVDWEKEVYMDLEKKETRKGDSEGMRSWKHETMTVRAYWDTEILTASTGWDTSIA